MKKEQLINSVTRLISQLEVALFIAEQTENKEAIDTIVAALKAIECIHQDIEAMEEGR